MKHFVCKKVPEGSNDINAFIAVAFNGKMIQTTNNYPYGNSYQPYGMFIPGYIYHTTSWSDDYLVDGNGVYSTFGNIADCFEEIEVKIDDEVARIIAKKEEKGDSISIQPLQIVNDGVVLYDVSCYHNGKTIRCIGASQYDCIINCYKRIREQDDIAKVFKYVVHGHIYPYGFLEEIKEKRRTEKNERIRKHT